MPTPLVFPYEVDVPIVGKIGVKIDVSIVISSSLKLSFSFDPQGNLLGTGLPFDFQSLEVQSFLTARPVRC